MKDVSLEAKKYFGIRNIKKLEFVSPQFTVKYKIVVFVPPDKTDELMYKMSDHGAGKIGKYSICSFRTEGTGTFKGSGSSNPAVGKKNRLERTSETKLEMICEKSELEKVIDAVYKFHPYEEPACEVYTVIVKETNLNKQTALIELKKNVKLADVIKKINSRIDKTALNIINEGVEFRKVFFDLTGKTDFKPVKSREKTLVIKKSKNIINIEVI